MRKTLHRFIVKATDIARPDDRTKWNTFAIRATRKEAWDMARQAVSVSFYRHVKIIEERQFKGAD